MIKQLLATVAVAAMAFGASAESKVLWEAPTAEGVLAGWGNPVFTLDAEAATQIKAGDNIVITVASVDKSLSDWPQVAINPGTAGGWPPALNALVSGPIESTFGITYDLASQIYESGISFYGDAVYLSKVTLEGGSVEVTPNTVWFGPKQCSWGDPAAVAKEVFADVKAGDVIKVSYDPNSEGLNFNLLFGGWGGCGVNINEVGKTDFITDNRETGWAVITLPESASNFEWEVDGATNTYDLYKLLKDGGLFLQGPCIFNQAQYFPAGEQPAEPTVSYYAVGGFQGWDPANPAEFTYADGVYTLEAKTATIKISTAKGDWDSFNAATIAPAGEGKFEVKADYQFTLDYEANWTITIDDVNKTIKFATEDAKPETVIYLRGGMNEWGAVDEWKFSTTDENIFTLKGVSIAAGVAFKIADANWGAINYGCNSPIAPNTTVTLSSDGGNCTLTEAVENANVEFNLTDKTLKVSTSTGVNAIENANEAVYYNLQGVKVANPVKGNVYIVKKGAKAVKAAF